MHPPAIILHLATAPLPSLKALEDSNHLVLSCSTRADFETILRTQPPDLILSDFSIPGLDLPIVLSLLAIRQLELPVLALSEQDLPENRTRLMAEGAADCIASGETGHLRLAVARELGNIRRCRELLARRTEAVRAVTARLAHDFNNVLAPVTMSAPMLKWDLEDAEFDDIVDTMEKSTSLGSAMIRDLLIYSRGMDLQRMDLDPESFIRGAAEEFRKALPPHTSLDLQFENGLTSLSADPERLRQALFCLLENAHEAMPEGGRIGIEVSRRLNDLQIVVQDEGTGIDPASLPQIFDPFFSTKRQQKKGTGLGLCRALGIIKSHGGNLSTRSQPGEGSRFEISLPFRKP